MADHSSNQSRIQITAYGISASPSHFYRLRVATAPSACDLTRRRGLRDTAGTVSSMSVVHLAGLFSFRQIGENVAAVQTRMEELPGGQHEFAFLVGKKYFERQDFGENWMVVHIKGLIEQIQIVKTEHPKDGHITLKNRSGYDINNLFTTVTGEPRRRAGLFHLSRLHDPLCAQPNSHGVSFYDSVTSSVERTHIQRKKACQRFC